MQVAPRYDDVVEEVAGFLEERLAVAVAAGIPEDHVCLDPGIGFGKTPDQNLELIRGLERLCRIGRPVLVGLSRKSTLARVLGDPIGARSARTPRRSALPSPRSIAGRHSFAPTPSLRTWRPWPRPPRSSGGAWDDDRALRIVLHGFHGVLEHERRDGQRFLVDVELDLEHEQASRTDQIEDAVDYREVVARVRAISDARATGCSRPSRPRSPTRSWRSSPSPRCAFGCASRTSCSTHPSSSRRSQSSAAGSRGRWGARTSGSERISATGRRR